MSLFQTKKKKTKEAAEKVGKDMLDKKDMPAKKSEVKAGNITGILQNPHITEKSTGQGEGIYAFSVAKNANKNQVKQAVQARYGVGVEKVRIINLPDKARRRGRQIGWKQGIKKAIVFLKEGEKIEIQ